MDYSFPWVTANWKIGANSVFLWHDLQSLSDQTQEKYNERNSYGHIEMVKNIGSLDISASSGINIAYRSMGQEHFTFVNWHPILDLAYHLGSHHNLELSYEYAGSNPGIDQLCDVNSATNPLFANIGDKDIKSSTSKSFVKDY